MPRLTQQPTVLPAALVQQLTELHQKLRGAEKEALERAREIGQLLLGVPDTVRPSLLAAAGISDRSGRDYVRIAMNWDVIRQHAATSIRGALGVLREIEGAPADRVDRYQLQLDNVSSPKALAQALASVHGRSVSIKIRVRHRHTASRNPTQLDLFDQV